MTTGQGADQPVGTLPGPTAEEDRDGTEWLVRSEERARVAFPTRVRSRVRLVKQVVTEEVTHTFTLRREVLRVEELPGDPDDPADAGLSWSDPLTDDEGARDLEIVLHAEQLVTSVAVVPVERVHVSTRVVTADVSVATELRREQVALTQDPASPVPYEQGTTHEQTGATDGGASPTQEAPA